MSFCEIIDKRFDKMCKMHGYYPKWCISASTLSGCIERDTWKVIFALPTNNDVFFFFFNLTGRFSCINTRLGFDSEIVMPNFSGAEFIKCKQ